MTTGGGGAGAGAGAGGGSGGGSRFTSGDLRSVATVMGAGLARLSFSKLDTSVGSVSIPFTGLPGTSGLRSGALFLTAEMAVPLCESRITFSYPGVSSIFLTTGTSSGSEELDCCLCLGCLGGSLEGGEEKGESIAGGCISLIAVVGSGLFLCGEGGLCSCVCMGG